MYTIGGVIALTWWMILLVAFGILGTVFGVYVLVRRIGWFVNGFVRGLLSELASQPLSGSESAKPRSLSSLENLLLPQVKRDFPEYNSTVIGERVKHDAFTYYESGRQNIVLYGKGTAKAFRESFAASLPDGVGGNILVHHVALHAYDTRAEDRLITYQAAVQYADTTGEIRQRRLVLRYLAAFTDDPSTEIKTFNCPNCGAPLPIVGSKTCRYCGTALKTPAGLGWVLVDAREG